MIGPSVPNLSGGTNEISQDYVSRLALHFGITVSIISASAFQSSLRSFLMSRGDNAMGCSLLRQRRYPRFRRRVLLCGLQECSRPQLPRGAGALALPIRRMGTAVSGQCWSVCRIPDERNTENERHELNLRRQESHAFDDSCPSRLYSICASSAAII